MRVAGIQISSGADAEKNISRALEMAEVAVEKEARVICYPELFLNPWFPRDEDRSYLGQAIGTAGGTFEKLLRFSRDAKVVLVAPFFESNGSRYFNSAAVIDSGRLLGVYRKLHLPDLPLYRERFYFSPGDRGLPVFETSQGRIGIQICWDNLFPEGSRILALKGAELILAPTAASQNTHHLWEKAITANAFANNLHVFRVNRVGREGELNFYGRSFCADPWGEMASELSGGRDAIVIADIQAKERDAARETWGFLKHRRPDEYGDLLK